MKYNTFCPLFPGFYNTVFECNSEDQEIDSYNEEYGTSYGYDDFKFDYRDYEMRIAKSFVNRLEKELNVFLPIKIEYERISSPKEYNFINDSIYVVIDVDINELLKLIIARFNEAKEYLEETYTSRSGFISYHSEGIADWLNKDYILENTGHRIGALLNCLCSIEIDQDNIIYWCDDEMHISVELNENAITH